MVKLQQELTGTLGLARGRHGDVVVNGKFEVLSLKTIRRRHPEIRNAFRDLVIAADNEGIRKAQEITSSNVQDHGGITSPA